MSFAKHGIAGQSLDLGKAVLTLSALGLFTKLLHIDLSQLQILGVVLQPSNANLIPGFLGLTLTYAFLCFVVARMEASIASEVDKDAIESRNKIKESKGLLALAFLIAPFSFVVYSLPYAFGLFTIILLRSDSMSVLKAIWALAS
jgi:hypothetical protein